MAETSTSTPTIGTNTPVTVGLIAGIITLVFLAGIAYGDLERHDQALDTLTDIVEHLAETDNLHDRRLERLELRTPAP